MTTNLTIRRATPQDTPVIHGLIRGLAEYEKRPQDMTATVEQLRHWLFERMAAGVLIAEIGGSAVGYALYYPIFGSFAAGRIYLEDLFVRMNTAETVLAERCSCRLQRLQQKRAIPAWSGAALTGISPR